MVLRKKVLIIDDEVDLCLLMKSYFLRKNYEVYIAHTLNDGVQRLDEIIPDYLFIDYNLPDGLGWDKLPEMYRKHPAINYHLISAFRPTIPPDLDEAKLTIWEKPISLKALDNFF
ncbi:response regulator [Flaviaesturariibacter aridisoli]|uniref:Response regulator n=1 Tax=Flaviaesturariibacter aridisoli TaxID=2545761 RepID=A0A4R4DZQ2_9BACT|nr:response regulator [Flaviaesturariibacter aridisoli]TCZ69580.1 response regulator [Flaviaesturariibacter aridisoli]